MRKLRACTIVNKYPNSYQNCVWMPSFGEDGWLLHIQAAIYAQHLSCNIATHFRSQE
jgi:hypothetical protein